ncbi:Chromatin assembly factor 1 subunit B [Hypsibius exemplaris]|uniref:Chromatin assembly factor 1 subunit B n=1 Tax=Hypsibius exemplaris TaxID=2072580 RepID=A0A9X6NFA7_HYPEX|nr:Chromatin assembly factor 1 subunit B [Hypsibius exemplaris]
MLVSTPEIQLHGKDTKSDPIYSVHVQPCPAAGIVRNGRRAFRIATGGVSEIRIWLVEEVTGTAAPLVEFRATLERHQAAINVVRFSPDGTVLASGDVDGVILLWKLVNEVDDPKSIKAEDLGFVNLESWTSQKAGRNHGSEVTDLAWSPDGRYLLSSSCDDTNNIYDVEKLDVVKSFSEAKAFVLGVSWHPRSRNVATISADRFLRLYDPFNKETSCGHKIHRFGTGAFAGELLFMGDDNCMARRRLDFSPDGKLLVAPSGAARQSTKADVKTRIACTYIFNVDINRDNKKIGNPVAVLPATAATSLVRFCPKLFTHRQPPANSRSTQDPDIIPMEVDEDAENEPVMMTSDTPKRHKLLLDGIPYRMIFAVATQKQVLFYDTDMDRPFALIDQIHATDLSDLAWSPDGRMLVVSSLDGFCTFVEFAEDELGQVYAPPVRVIPASVVLPAATAEPSTSRG